MAMANECNNTERSIHKLDHLFVCISTMMLLMSEVIKRRLSGYYSNRGKASESMCTLPGCKLNTSRGYW